MTEREAAPVSAADEVRVQLRQELVAALKAGQRSTVAVLRTAIAAIDNAEAVDADPATQRTEVARRALTYGEVSGVLESHIEELAAAAASYRAIGQDQEADELTQQSVVLRRLVLEPGG